MLGGFRVKADVGGARFCKIGHQRIDGRHHQMHVDRRRNSRLAQRLADQRPDGEIGDVK